MGANRVQNRRLNRLQSRLDRSQTGRLVLTVSYRGKDWDAAIQQAIMDYGLGDCEGVTVIAVPAGMI